MLLTHKHTRRGAVVWMRAFTLCQLTRPISEVHETTMVLGTVVDSLTREVMFMGLLGLFGSTPFLVGGRYPCSKQRINTLISQSVIAYD